MPIPSLSHASLHGIGQGIKQLGGWLILLSALPSGIARGEEGGGQGVTFSGPIARIFQKRCQECHRPGEIAPMSLLTYAEARPWVKAIKAEVVARRMPPWHADSKPGEFKNDIGLTAEDLDLIVRWADGGAIEGSPGDLPPPLQWDNSGWKAGQPDLVLYPERAFSVPATKQNADLYQCLVLPTGLEEDGWLQGIEYRPDNRQIVHHIIAFADNKGLAGQRDAETPESGFPCGMGTDNRGLGSVISIDSMLGGWAPGTPPIMYDEGQGKPIKKGSAIILQMHYFNQTGKEQSDKSGIGIHWAKGTIHQQSRAMPVVPPINTFGVKAGDADAEHRGQWLINRGVVIHSLAPHMHFLGKDMAFVADYPDGTKETLLTVPRFDFNWQKPYVFSSPRNLPKGSVLRTLSHHDNSAANPRNPSKPPIDVKWGESTTEEMSIGWVGYSYTDEDLAIPIERKPRSSQNVAEAGSKEAGK